MDASARSLVIQEVSRWGDLLDDDDSLRSPDDDPHYARDRVQRPDIRPALGAAKMQDARAS